MEGDPFKLPEGGMFESSGQQAVDTSFQFGITNFYAGVEDIALLPDGRIAFAGATTPSLGVLDENGSVLMSVSLLASSGYSVAVDRDGAVLGAGDSNGSSVRRMPVPFEDTTFRIENGALSFRARKLLLRADRSMIVAGTMMLRNAGSGYGLLKVKQTGGIDADFTTADARGIEVTTAGLTESERIVGGYSQLVGGVTTYSIGRWSTNGVRDTNYSGAWLSAIGTNAQVTALERVPGESGFLAAVQYEENGVKTKLVRLAGEEDPQAGEPIDFPSPEILGRVNAIAFEVVKPETARNDGYDHVLIGGAFTNVAGVHCNNLAALSREGKAVWGFGFANEGPNGPIHAVEVQVDGRVLIGGAFSEVSEVPTGRMARLAGNSAQGATYLYWGDTEFRGFEKQGGVSLPLKRFGNTNTTLQVDVELSAAVGGTASDFGAVTERPTFQPGQSEVLVHVPIHNDTLLENRERFTIRVSTTETNVLVTRGVADLVVLDDETPGTLSPDRLYEEGAPLQNFAVQPDGKILLVRSGTTILRLNADGTRDESFVTNGISTLAGSWAVWSVLPQEDGKIYVGGRFVTTSGYGINHLARLNADGTLDQSFNPMLAPPSNPNPGHGVLFDVFSDGKVIVYVRGSIQRAGGAPGEVMFRVRNNGTFDRGYQGTAMTDTGEIEALPNGQVIAYTDRLSSNIRRFDTNGTAVAAFNVQVPSTVGYVYDLEVLGDALLVGGSFKQLNSLTVSNLAKVSLATGVVDTNFATRLDGEVTTVQAHEGKIYIAGAFTRVNGIERTRIARLNGDGSLDSSFDAGLGPNNRPGLFEVEENGSILMGVNFSAVDRVATSSLVRLEGDKTELPTPTVSIGMEGGIKIQYSGATLEGTSDFSQWEEVHAGGGVYEPSEDEAFRFFRAVKD